MDVMILAVPDLPAGQSRRLLRDLQDHVQAFIADVDAGYLRGDPSTDKT